MFRRRLSDVTRKQETFRGPGLRAGCLSEILQLFLILLVGKLEAHCPSQQPHPTPLSNFQAYTFSHSVLAPPPCLSAHLLTKFQVRHCITYCLHAVHIKLLLLFFFLIYFSVMLNDLE